MFFFLIWIARLSSNEISTYVKLIKNFNILCSKYTIVGPGTIHSNRDYNVAVAVHQTKEPVTLKVGITGPSYNETQDVELASSDEFKQITFKLPPLESGEYNLTAEGVKGLEFKNTTKLSWEKKQKHQQQHQPTQQQQQQQHPQTTQQQAAPPVSTATTSPAGQANPGRMGGKSPAGNITIRHTVPMQKPTITMSTVQPQAKMPVQVATASVPVTVPVPAPVSVPIPAPVASTHHPPATPNPGKLPQLPPRVPSQPSTESLASISSPPPKIRTPLTAPPGPPPAIPPRTGAIARSGSVPAARSFVRQASANSTPPQYTPQPPPPFVIPKRHTGLARASTLSSSSSKHISSKKQN